ncbi:DUF1801 domain-containing protein [Sulfitobacter porphyrae]|uniref:DUF1801 domain-containing protein n=1 Tax=Sulfitobacter porphyrae TaxID=1246864 RepID=A0ABW2B8I9_9RHOB|nr:hypothetical protein GCM10007928_36050 [Sulfitobacter porphyrae]
MSKEFEHFLNDRVQPQFRDIVLAFVAQMARVAPAATLRMRGGTEKYYAVPVFRVNRDVVAISPTKTFVTFSFTKGAHFDDPFGMLRGTGKHSRNLQVKSMDQYPNEPLQHYIRQAVETDIDDDPTA